MATLVQGDTFNLTITVNENANLIERIYFTCKYLKLKIECEKVNDNQYLVSTTPDFKLEEEEHECSFDVTAFLSDNQRQTIIYNEPLTLLKKENELDGD